jgi:hypothetical protein
VYGPVVRHEDAPDLKDEGDFEWDNDQGVDGDGHMEELSRVSVGPFESF